MGKEGVGSPGHSLGPGSGGLGRGASCPHPRCHGEPSAVSPESGLVAQEPEVLSEQLALELMADSFAKCQKFVKMGFLRTRSGR